MFAAERNDKSTVVQVSGVLFQYLETVTCRNELDREKSSPFELCSRLTHVGFKLSKITFGIIGQEWISGNASSRQNDLTNILDRQKCCRSFCNEGSATR